MCNIHKCQNKSAAMKPKRVQKFRLKCKAKQKNVFKLVSVRACFYALVRAQLVDQHLGLCLVVGTLSQVFRAFKLLSMVNTWFKDLGHTQRETDSFGWFLIWQVPTIEWRQECVCVFGIHTCIWNFFLTVQSILIYWVLLLLLFLFLLLQLCITGSF